MQNSHEGGKNLPSFPLGNVFPTAASTSSKGRYLGLASRRREVWGELDAWASAFLTSTLGWLRSTSRFLPLLLGGL